jgi:hypothetical protein
MERWYDNNEYTIRMCLAKKKKKKVKPLHSFRYSIDKLCRKCQDKIRESNNRIKIASSTNRLLMGKKDKKKRKSMQRNDIFIFIYMHVDYQSFYYTFS